ncbi:MAG: hypothetical protein JWM01_2850 [Arthrobacter sp.]|jgi:hypothetical protein|nr:hypothetical protein [Arthrobacter sp.]
MKKVLASVLTMTKNEEAPIGKRPAGRGASDRAIVSEAIHAGRD